MGDELTIYVNNFQFYVYKYSLWMEAIVTELLIFAFKGVNNIATVMLILIELYWLIAIIGIFDFEFLDFDLEGGDAAGPIAGIFMFINIGQVPVALVFTLVGLNFWILMMFTYFLPITPGGIISAILLIPALFLSIYITKKEMIPLKKIFPEKQSENDIEHKVLTRRCKLLCALEHGMLGQAVVHKEGASIVINVKTLFETESFDKNEVAFVFKKDTELDVYYIAKTLMADEFKL